jgi:hypothetical protein
MININMRLGIGFDIEHNDNICHVVGDDEGRFVAAYEGLIIQVFPSSPSTLGSSVS